MSATHFSVPVGDKVQAQDTSVSKTSGTIENESHEISEESTSDNSTAAEVNSQNQELITLNEEQKAAIVKQVEFYFSDVNLPYDKFLKSQLELDAEGFVKLEVILTFRRMLAYKDCLPQVAAALRASQELIVSEDGLKVRRKAELNLVPLTFKERRDRTLVFSQFPFVNGVDYSEFYDYLRDCLIKAYGSTEVKLSNTFARAYRWGKKDIANQEKVNIAVEFVQTDYALKLLEYFGTTPCVYKDSTLGVMLQSEHNNQKFKQFSAENIVKLSGFSGEVSNKLIFEVLGENFSEFVVHIGIKSDMKEEPCSEYCYIALCVPELVPAILEKFNSSNVTSELNKDETKESEERAYTDTEVDNENGDQSEETKKNISKVVNETGLTATIPTDTEVEEAHSLFAFSKSFPLNKFCTSSSGKRSSNKRAKRGNNPTFKRRKLDRDNLSPSEI